jgi:DNA-binding transcriptional LysR family regulator
MFISEYESTNYRITFSRLNMFNSEQRAPNWDWDDLRTVLAVADSGSLSGAARLLGTSHPTVYRRIRELEARIGTVLFDKAATGYLPTNAGEIAINTARKVAVEVNALNLELGLGAPPVAGELRLSCSDTVYPYILAPMLAEFRRLYPDVSLQVLVTNELVNLQRQDIDVAIRSARRSEQTLYGIKLSDMTIGAYAARGHPVLEERPVRLSAHDWVGYDETLVTSGLARFMREHDLERRVVFRANSLLVACEAIRNGIGLGLMPAHVAAANDDVVRISAPDAEVHSELWAVSTRFQQQKPLIRAFFAFIEEHMKPLRTTLTGSQTPAHAG